MIGFAFESFFPDRCLGYGCAKWAIVSARAFADEFYNRMGVVFYKQVTDLPELP